MDIGPRSSKIRLSALAFAALTATAVNADAQVVEVSGNVGYSFSEGVTGDGVLAGDGNIYDELNPTSSGGYHFTFGITPAPNYEVGFLWARQQSELEAKGTATLIVGDLDVDTYHGYFAYNFGAPSSPVRPFLMLGLGATNFGSVSFVGSAGQQRETESVSRFSTSVGGGVKAYLGRAFGVRLAARWTPTYISSEAAGWWCDPFWGCYVLENTQYANQFDLSGGVVLRF
jgi:hypothetical protein